MTQVEERTWEDLFVTTAQVLLDEGRAALRAGDAERARRAFESALTEGPSGDATEGLARASYLSLDFAAAVDAWCRAYALHRTSDDHVGAVRVARTLSCIYMMVLGEFAVAKGWLARAQTLLARASDSSERGWVALDVGMFEDNRARKEDHFRDALIVAREFRDVELELVTLSYLGASLVHADRTEEGMLLLDESLAAVTGNEVDDFFVLEEVFCQLFSACEHAHDVHRADQWIRIGDVIAQKRNLPAVSAFCRTHYGGVLTAAGRWPEADATLTEAVRLWGLGQRSMLRRGALARLADLRVRQGRFEEAAELLSGLDADSDPELARPLAALRLARGETALARDTLERALAHVDATSSGAASLLALLVDVHLASGDATNAAAAAEQLATCAAAHHGHYLGAVAALARGRVCLATGTGEPQTCLREALAGFARAEMPMELARARLELAHALVGDHPEVAIAEARSALEAFERLEAARDVDAAAAVLRTLGVSARTTTHSGEVLTKREAEVLELLGHGLTNPEIAERLYISRKTAEHHVGNVLAKLGLRSRAEAAAFVARNGTRA